MNATRTASTRPLGYAALLVLAAAGAVLLWLSTSSTPETRLDRTAVPIGAVGDFPPGSTTEVLLDVGHLNPFPFEGGEAPEIRSDRMTEETRLFVVNHPERGLLALLVRSPWRGCRVVTAGAADAVRYGHRVPEDFAGGFIDPCHGGFYDLDGTHLDGPGFRGLDRFPVVIAPDGSVTVDLTSPEPGPMG